MYCENDLEGLRKECFRAFVAFLDLLRFLCCIVMNYCNTYFTEIFVLHCYELL